MATSLAFVPSLVYPFSTSKFFILRLGLVLILFFRPLQIKSIRLHRIDVFLLIWLVWMGVSAVTHVPWPQSGFRVEGLILLIMLYSILRTSQVNVSRFKSAALIIVVPAIIQSLIGVMQYFDLFTLTSGFFAAYESQVFGTVGGSNTLGAFLAISTPFLLLLIRRSTNREKTIWIISLLLIITSLILTKSRGAWMAVLVGMSVYKWDSISQLLRGFLQSKKLLIFIPVVIIGLIIFSVWIYSLNPASASGRLFIWSISLDMIGDHLWAGVGYGNFGLNWLEYQGNYLASPEALFKQSATNIASAHSQYLHVFAETGVIGFGAFLALGLSIFSSIHKSFSRAKSLQSDVLRTLGAAFAIFYTHALVDDIFNPLVIKLQFLVLLALYISALNPIETSKQRTMIVSQKWLRLLLIPLLYFLIVFTNGKIKGELLWKQGQRLTGTGKWEQGIEKYKKAREYLPHNSKLKFYLGAAYSKIGQAKSAVQLIKESMQTMSDKNQYIALGKAYIDNGDYELAESTLARVLYYYPALLSPHYWLSRVYFEQGDIERAKRELQIIIEAENTLNSAEIEQVKADASRALRALEE